MAVRTEMLSQPTRVNFRAWLAFLFGLVAVAAIPVAIELTRKISGASLLDAAWAIPIAAGCARSRGRSNRSAERAGSASAASSPWQASA
jgi:hypothetical protein